MYKAFRDGGSLLNNSAKPLSASVIEATAQSNVGQLKADSGVFKSSANLPSLDLPTATLGQFIKDVEGTIFGTTTGTGFTSYPELYCSTDPNTPAGNGETACAAPLSYANTGSTIDQNWARIIKAKAGEYLKIKTPTASTLTDLFMELGGVGNSVGDWL